jgi:2-dehydropantoate 2-reductase
MERDSRPRVAVLGAGAVGSYFGGLLARSGLPVTLIGRTPHVDAIVREGLLLERSAGRERIRAEAATEVSSARGAAIVLFAVKATATEDAASTLAPHLSPDTIVVSLQNGVDNAEKMRSAAGIDPVTASVYVAARMEAPGHVVHTGRGDLVIGNPPGSTGGRERLAKVAKIFEGAGVPCVLSENIAGELWTKLAMNCAYNAVSALSRARYGTIAADSDARDVMRRAADEVVAVGVASGVRFPRADLAASVMALARAMPEAISSTAQDLAQGKRTEIDSLNGFVARRGAELGIDTPINRTLHALVKLLEKTEPTDRRTS